MELHPILEKESCPNERLWYVLSAIGECPSLRVGHSCTYVASNEGGCGKVYIIGGANPSGCFNDTYVLDLNTLSWDTIDTPGFCSRYEHSAFSAESEPNKIYVFGGANQSGNLNDIQVLGTANNTWSTVSVKGEPPSARTYHTTACAGDKFIVYSGGQTGADPVGDRQVHCFDVLTKTWTVLPVKGDPPKPRHGHVMVAVGNKMYVHGGMSGTTFYDDLHVLDLDKNTWSLVKQKKDRPCSRAAHGGVSLGGCLYVFGGMNKDGALDDLYKFDVASTKWHKMEFEGPPPASRLDFAMCTIDFAVSTPVDSDLTQKTQEAKMALDAQIDALKLGDKVAQPNTTVVTTNKEEVTESATDGAADSHNQSNEGDAPLHENTPGATGGAGVPKIAEKVVSLCFVNGGMDTVGEIFDDCMVIILN